VIDASTRLHTFKGWGTPTYLPPEGWEGPEGPTPTSSYDLYSLGVLLFELTTLRLPFEGNRDALMRGHLYQAPPSPLSLRLDVSPQLDALILQLLQKDPARRGDDAAAVRTALRSIHANVVAKADSSRLAGPIEAALDRLHQGVSALVQEESAAEARRRARGAAEQARVDRFNAGLEILSRLIDEAVVVVHAHATPLKLRVQREEQDVWTFTLPPSENAMEIRLSPALDAIFLSERKPGDIVGFGHVEVLKPGGAGRRTPLLPAAGANIVMYVREEAPWVPRLQIVELRNSALVEPMHRFEPFFLGPTELGEHGAYLWGGAVHVFQSTVSELTSDVLVEWLSRLV
jgi:hypothetical protein